MKVSTIVPISLEMNLVPLRSSKLEIRPFKQWLAVRNGSSFKLFTTCSSTLKILLPTAVTKKNNHHGQDKSNESVQSALITKTR